MDYGPGARALVAALVRAQRIEVRRVELVSRALAARCAELERPLAARELERWLEAHPQVEEMLATETQLEGLLAEHLPPPARPIVSVRDAALERQITSIAGDDDARAAAVAVYADWLQERGDPFGDQLALALASIAGGDDRFGTWIDKHAASVLGEPLRGIVREGLYWRWGHVRRIDDTFPWARDVANWVALLQTRSCSMLRQLTFTRGVSPALDAAVADVAPESLSAVEVTMPGHARWRPPARLAQLPLGRFAIYADEVEIDADTFAPELVYLRLSCRDIRVVGAPITLPEVRWLHVVGNPANAALVRSAFVVPKLERLTIEPYDEDGARVCRPDLFAKLPGYLESDGSGT